MIICNLIIRSSDYLQNFKIFRTSKSVFEILVGSHYQSASAIDMPTSELDETLYLLDHSARVLFLLNL